MKKIIINLIFNRYSISNADRTLPFSVDENSGYLRVIKWLDYENASFYRFEVSAKVFISLCSSLDINSMEINPSYHRSNFSANTIAEREIG